MEKSVGETSATSRVAEDTTSAAPNKDTSDHSSTEESTPKDTAEQQQGPPQSPQSFAAAVFPGFNPPKINTSAFFSSMQGKFQSTIASAKSPALNMQAPQINKVDIKQIQASTEQLANTTKDWGVSAFKSLSSAAQRVSANVTQGIQKEHDEFVRQKKLDTVTPHQGTESLPVWDKRNFLLPPPPGTDFVFDMNVYSSAAVATLKHDPNLDRMRFYLVPKEVEELVFWRNYFYRVSLLKQVALATAAGAPDTFSEGLSGEGNSESNGNGQTNRPLSESSALGYNIYFGTDDVEGPPQRKSRPTSIISKDTKVTSPSGAGSPLSATKESTKASKKQEPKPEILFEAEMPDHDEDPDAWLEKQLASGVSIGDGDDGDVDVGDWEKELQNELKDYVEGS
ncbi:Synapse-associated protein 1 [Entomortierella beljakovae]|nr:Synapse-associated protein 1 [Entomortierella beljakovae]